jgi:hypothetical protein
MVVDCPYISEGSKLNSLEFCPLEAALVEAADEVLDPWAVVRCHKAYQMEAAVLRANTLEVIVFFLIRPLYQEYSPLYGQLKREVFRGNL